jgi:hypothetical protein
VVLLGPEFIPAHAPEAASNNTKPQTKTDPNQKAL